MSIPALWILGQVRGRSVIASIPHRHSRVGGNPQGGAGCCLNQDLRDYDSKKLFVNCCVHGVLFGIVICVERININEDGFSVRQVGFEYGFPLSRNDGEGRGNDGEGRCIVLLIKELSSETVASAT